MNIDGRTMLWFAAFITAFYGIARNEVAVRMLKSGESGRSSLDATIKDCERLNGYAGVKVIQPSYLMWLEKTRDGMMSGFGSVGPTVETIQQGMSTLLSGMAQNEQELKELREIQSTQSGDVQRIVETMESQGVVVKTMHDSLNRKGRRGR